MLFSQEHFFCGWALFSTAERIRSAVATAHFSDDTTGEKPGQRRGGRGGLGV